MTDPPLRVFNSLSRRPEAFEPSSSAVGLYSCGPTVYSYPHLGNMRAYVFADTLRRALRWRGYQVRQVVNITDVGHAVADSDVGDDKLEVAAARERRTVHQIAEHYTQAFMDDIAALRILPADEYPRASRYVEGMIEFAARLEEQGYAYRIRSGLYFDTTKSVGYGTLGRLNLEGQREGARVERVQGRRTGTDFALWRAEAPGERRAMRWESPWGWGAPGWHLECSVMSIALLGRHFDVHTGGVDHRELHHVNEIAQSEAYLGDGRPWVKYWMHNEFLQISSAKMAKSSGRPPRLSDLSTHPLAFRLFLLGGHYRAQLDYTRGAIESAQVALRRLVQRAEALRPLPTVETLAAARELVRDDPVAGPLLARIDTAVADDLATPQLLAALQEVVKHPELEDTDRAVLIAACDALMGLGLADVATTELGTTGGSSARTEDLDEEARRLLDERARAREARDWARADAIRDELSRLRIHVADTAQGQSWRVN
jgi:cysteinyl-tRNA synthetase